MRVRKGLAVVLGVMAVATVACGPLSGLASSAAKNAVPQLGALATAVTGAEAQASSGASQSTSSGGNAALPTNTVPYKAGQVYKVGEAIKDEKTGVIFLVDSVRFDSSLAGLESGQTWCLVTITLGNAGTQAYSASSISSFGIKSTSTGKSYTEPLSAILLQVVTTETQLDQTVEPGKAFQGIFPVILPADATGLEVNFTPIEYISQGLTFHVNLGK